MKENFQEKFYALLEQKHVITAAVLGVILLLGYDTAYIAPHPKISHLMRDIGIALVVSAYLAITIERLNEIRSRHDRDDYVRAVGDNLIKAVYGRELPLPLFDLVRRTLLEQPFIRTEYNIQMTLTDLTDHYISSAPPLEQSALKSFLADSATDKCAPRSPVVMKAAAQFRVTNVSATTRNYDVVWSMRKPFGGSYNGICGITSLMVNRQEQISEPGFRDQSAASKSSPTLEFHKAIQIGPSESAYIELECYSLRSCDDNEPWHTMIPCRGLTASVHDADGNKDVKIAVDAPVAAIDASAATNRATKSDRTNKASLAVESFLLPYQGITIYWSRYRGDRTPVSPAVLPPVVHEPAVI